MSQSFSFMWSDQLEGAIKAAALEQCLDGFRMTVANEGEYNAIVDAWNLGIDSHLEALTSRSSITQGHGRASANIHPKELHVLVRRLISDDYARTEAGDLLASSICETLGIKLI